ncbi:hypothetical protein [Paenibacillus agaridevorans]|uniref:hypothetical protein n=1 Tax=Paenibacillus agaridevorans TaxID=171404 RepID=UPI001BE4D689|nr:hypothetical protein [Paenibacillus agaridevorans]
MMAGGAFMEKRASDNGMSKVMDNKPNAAVEGKKTWTDTRVAVRLNGIARGYSNMERLLTKLQYGEMPVKQLANLKATLFKIRW